jgi:hypothetical protein
MIRTLFFILSSLSFIVVPLQAEAAKKPQSDKEAVILLPLVISAEAQSIANEMQAAVVQGLQQKYKVYSGDRVLQELKKATDKENHRAKHDCDETRCLQDIATAFQTENVAIAHIIKIEGGYLLSLSIKAVISNEALFDNSIPCKACDAFAVVDRLKELAGTVAPVALPTAPESPSAKVNLSDPETALWEEAKKGNAQEDYQAYLTTYPKGKYAPLAKTKLARLKDEASALAVQQDQQAWNTAQQDSSKESYATYLSLYPQGQFAALAQGRIGKIKREAAAAEATQIKEKVAAETNKAAALERQKQEAVATTKGFVSQGGLTWMPITVLTKNWTDANAYCNTTTIKGQSGWRLPTKDELVALFNSGAINNQGWTLANTWSSTSTYSLGGHYDVSLQKGNVVPIYDTDFNNLTCVR